MADLESKARMKQIDVEATEKRYGLQKARDLEQDIRAIEIGGALYGAGDVEIANSTVLNSSLDQANRKRQRSKQEAPDKTLEIVSANPTITPPEIADMIGKSRQPVYGYLDEPEAAGRLHRNGSLRVIQ